MVDHFSGPRRNTIIIERGTPHATQLVRRLDDREVGGEHLGPHGIEQKTGLAIERSTTGSR